MIDESLWDRAMVLLDKRNEQCSTLIGIVKERDSYLEKAAAMLKDRDSTIAYLHQQNAQLSQFLKFVAEDPALLKRKDYQDMIQSLASTH